MASRAAIAALAVAACVGVYAQQKPKPSGTALPPVTITAPSRGDPVEKSYRKMVRGMDLFERLHALAPNAPLRFKLLPRKHDTDMDRIALEVIGDTVDIPIKVAPDRTFTLPRDRKAWDENAVVSPNRRKQSMTWRTDIRTPGLPPDTRRLGDLRLECEVGIEAELVSNNHSVIGALANLFADSLGYCKRKDARYLFFADRALFSVTLTAANRREVLPIDKLYAMAIDDPDLKGDLAFCDCEVLVDRTYYLPLGDGSWPDDTWVRFDYMDDGNAPANQGASLR
ncbi:MAG: hypothetical protein ACXWJM_03865 [Ramlibacter sp.]